MRDMSTDELMRLLGKTVYSVEGQKIGGIETIYLSEETNRPQWLGLEAGIFGSKRIAVPAGDIEVERNGIRVPYRKDRVTHSPSIGGDRISAAKEEELFEHYGLYGGADTGPMESRLGRGADRDQAPPPGRSATDFRAQPGDRPPADVEDVARWPAASSERPEDRNTMTLREERLRVGKRDVTTAVQMHKYVDVAPVEQDVELRKETVRIERVPVNRPAAPGEFREQQFTIELHEEMPIISKDVVATEEIRLQRETRTEHQRVRDEVRKERVELEGDSVQQQQRRPAR